MIQANVGVVILNWNKAELTARCLDSVRRVLTSPAMLICVDNGSREPLEDIGDDVVVLRNPVNCGFAGGVNKGLAYAFTHGAEYVWLLNNDAEPLPGALDALLDAVTADISIGLASSVILNSEAEDAVDFHGGCWDALGNYRTTTSPAEYEAWSQTIPDKIWLVGTALLVARRLIERIGYFDEDFFAYWEDNDISRRSNAAGFRNVVVAQSLVRHECGTDEHGKMLRLPYYFYYMSRNEILVLRKHGGLIRQLRPLYWALRRQIRLLRQLSNRPAQQQAIRKGVIHGLLGRTGNMSGS